MDRPATPPPPVAGRVEEWGVAAIAAGAVLAGLWAARNLYRSRHTANISDYDGEFFDPHGLTTLLSEGVAAAAVVTVPLLLVLLTAMWQRRHRRWARRAAVTVLGAGAVAWVVVGVLALHLDASTAHFVDPMIGGPKGRSLLTPLGLLLVGAGGLGVVACAATLLATAGGDRTHNPVAAPGRSR